MRWYTCYDTESDEVIASGTAAQCAKALRLTVNSFYCAVTRSGQGKLHKYKFFVEEIKKEDLPQ